MGRCRRAIARCAVVELRSSALMREVYSQWASVASLTVARLAVRENTMRRRFNGSLSRKRIMARQTWEAVLILVDCGTKRTCFDAVTFARYGNFRAPIPVRRSTPCVGGFSSPHSKHSLVIGNWILNTCTFAHLHMK